MSDFDLSGFEMIKENVYVGIMTFGDYISYAKENLTNESEGTIIDIAELEAIKYNNDIENNEVFVDHVHLFITEDGPLIFDTFSTLMMLNLEKRFMNNKLGVSVYTVSVEKARGIFKQINVVDQYIKRR